MNIKMLVISLAIFLNGCQGYVFLHDKSPTIKLLENKTKVTVSGNDISIIKSKINNIVGNSEEDGNFLLLVTSTKTTNNAVIKNNQAASQIEIKHTLNYSLQKKDKECVILDTKISSISDYNLKSSGYSFGTDIAKKETIDKNIEKNINVFFKFLNHNHPNLNCNNED